MSTKINIHDVNGIADLTINLTEPGVYVARGRNGAGKTSAVNALRAAAGDPDAIVAPTDGLERGQVELGGVVLHVGARRRLNGTPSVQLGSAGALGRLIDPGVKDPDVAAKTRLKALLELVPLPADADAAKELSGGDPELAEVCAGKHSDALALAEAVRLKAQDLARTAEAAAAKSHGAQELAEKQIAALGPVDDAAGDAQAVSAAHQQALRDADRVAVQAKARTDLDARQDAIRKSIGKRPDVDALIGTRDDLAKKRDAAKATLDKLLTDHRVAEAAAADAQRAATSWDAQSAVLNQPVEGPTTEDAKAAAAAAQALGEKAARAQVLSLAIGLRRQAGEARDTSEAAAKRATEARAIATRTTFALGKLLQRRGLPGITLHAGRLAHIDSAGEVHDFDSRLSFGQRVRIALGIALYAKKDGTAPIILPLEPRFWLELDPEHKAEVAKAAKEAGVYLITEEPTDGPVRVEPIAEPPS